MRKQKRNQLFIALYIALWEVKNLWNLAKKTGTKTERINELKIS